MEHSRKEKIKLYLVLALVILFAAVAYFRFAGPKSGQGAPGPPVASRTSVSVPEIDIQTERPVLPFEKSSLELLEKITRNIFKPGQGVDLQAMLPQKGKLAREKPEKPDLSGLNLEATILGQRKLAIINGRMLFPGDSLAGHRLVAIEKDSVLLKTDNFLQRLKIMNHE
ncbi:MAG: hypothetical protein K9K79_05645 [Desulfohalobiaceae bacterium]|nr:hypothetical protein [Desulfohalobiaceae bacterium]